MVANDKHHRESWLELREEQDVQRLREFSAFSDFSDAELQRLVRAAHRETTSSPWPLIHEQTPSDACYILLSGDVGVYVGREQVATLGAGEVIGESALRQGQLRSATVTTTGPAELLRIERDDLAGLLEEIPAFRQLMDANAARHARVEPTPAAAAEPKRAKLNVSVPVDLVGRFEKAASAAGLDIAAALEGALSQWIETNG